MERKRRERESWKKGGKKSLWYRGKKEKNKKKKKKEISCLKFLSSPFRISIFRNEIGSTWKEEGGWKAGKYYKYYSNWLTVMAYFAILQITVYSPDSIWNMFPV